MIRLRSVSRFALPLALGLALSGCAGTPELRPFTTDGCSLFPDRLLSSGKDWCLCCVAHDRIYWRGGTDADRLKADQELRACVASTTGDKGLATLMYVGVRIGGGPYLPTWFRWGYGWTYGRFYQPLRPEESAAADKLEAEYAASVGFGMCPGAPPAELKQVP
jgi:hypothetical protein